MKQDSGNEAMVTNTYVPTIACRIGAGIVISKLSGMLVSFLGAISLTIPVVNVTN